MSEFYTYLWLREDGRPYYVGKGKKYRAFTSEEHCCQPPPTKDRILLQEFPDEASAFAAERFLISFYGRLDLGAGCLRNLTDGGEGCAGHIRSPEFREKLRVANLGRKQSPETIAKRAASNTGKKRTEETKLKMSLAAKRYKKTPAHRKNMSLSCLGRAPHNKGKKGPPCSPEAKEKLRAAALAYYARKKGAK